MSDAEKFYIEHGWSGCAGSSWERLTEATKDGWRAAAAAEARAEAAERKVAAVEAAIRTLGGGLDAAAYLTLRAALDTAADPDVPTPTRWEVG